MNERKGISFMTELRKRMIEDLRSTYSIPIGFNRDPRL